MSQSNDIHYVPVISTVLQAWNCHIHNSTFALPVPMQRDWKRRRKCVIVDSVSSVYVAFSVDIQIAFPSTMTNTTRKKVPNLGKCEAMCIIVSISRWRLFVLDFPVASPRRHKVRMIHSIASCFRTDAGKRWKP